VERLSKPYSIWKTYGKAAKKAYSRPKLKALYELKVATIGSVRSMCIGRVRVLVAYVLTIFGNDMPSVGDCGRGRLRCFARRRRSTGLYDSA
jgi:hypothetical protein